MELKKKVGSKQHLDDADKGAGPGMAGGEGDDGDRHDDPVGVAETHRQRDHCYNLHPLWQRLRGSKPGDPRLCPLRAADRCRPPLRPGEFPLIREEAPPARVPPGTQHKSAAPWRPEGADRRCCTRLSMREKAGAWAGWKGRGCHCAGAAEYADNDEFRDASTAVRNLTTKNLVNTRGARRQLVVGYDAERGVGLATTGFHVSHRH